MTDNRKNYFLGIAPGEMLVILIALLTGIATVTTYASTVQENKHKIEAIPREMNKLKDEMISEIKSSENRTSDRINRLDERMTRSSEENRKLLIQILKSK